MSKQHVEEYFLEVCQQYKEMNQALRDLENTTDPEVASYAVKNLPSIKANVAKLKENYDRISWVIFLLNKPTRKEKEADYARRESKVRGALNENASLNRVLEENEQVVEYLKGLQEV